MVQYVPSESSESLDFSPSIQALVVAIQEAESGKEKAAISKTIDALFAQVGGKKTTFLHGLMNEARMAIPGLDKKMRGDILFVLTDAMGAAIDGRDLVGQLAVRAQLSQADIPLAPLDGQRL